MCSFFLKGGNQKNTLVQTVFWKQSAVTVYLMWTQSKYDTHVNASSEEAIPPSDQSQHAITC